MPSKVYTPQHGSLISRFDLTGWTRQKGNVIRIETRGDPEDQVVMVAIRAVLGTTLKEGPAAYAEVCKSWFYQTTAEMPKAEILIVYAMPASSAASSTVNRVRARPVAE